MGKYGPICFCFRKFLVCYLLNVVEETRSIKLMEGGGKNSHTGNKMPFYISRLGLTSFSPSFVVLPPWTNTIGLCHSLCLLNGSIE